MELSPLHWKDRERHTHVGALDFAMFVYNNGFKVGLYYTAPNTSGHWCCIYDSATHSWSSLPKLPFSPSYVKARKQRNIAYEQSFPPRAVFPDLDDYFYDLTILGLYDFGRARWCTGAAVRSLRITTGHEDKVEEGTCTTRLWEHNGQRYFASGWIYAGGDREEGDCGVDGYGVWKVDENGGLVPVSAVLHDAILEEVYPGRRNLGYIFRCNTAAEGNLVTFSETGIVFVYYLSTGQWGGVDRNPDDFAKAVLYRPSLRTLKSKQHELERLE
ncbi:hypothetical protein SELMODRAFT_429444 [Selaginella moellendorffii]|uniref:Uncharacterized protein n=1 Tax=Selaginella moellendorffii TaxID=88036 RepID=D8T671_SELML|nr:hypothetical protein SELMODRAFT_429444 [Selaginella moellendorffii]